MTLKFTQEQLDVIESKEKFSLVNACPGCVSGDTIIHINRGGKGKQFTIKDAFYKQNCLSPNSNMSWDPTIQTTTRALTGGWIKLHNVDGIVHSGMRVTYQLVLSSGHTLRATSDHKIMTKRGFVELVNLVVGSDEVMIDTHLPKKSRTKTKRRDEVVYDLKFHPNAYLHRLRKTKRLEKFKLVYEAYLNGMALEKFVEILKYDESAAKKLKFIDFKKYTVHHIDRNWKNNALSNLELMDRRYHYSIEHGEEYYKNFSQGCPSYSVVVSVSKFGVEETFDIQCAAPHHNFVANGIVVHNSGKTTTCVNKMLNQSASSKKLLVAFNREAALELDSRLKKLGCQNFKAQTFHGYAAGLIKAGPKTFGFSQSPEIVPTPDYFNWLREAFKPDAKTWRDFNIDFDFFKDLEKSKYDYEIKQFLDSHPMDLSLSQTEIKRIRSYMAVDAWRKHLVKNNILTFDMMVRLLAEKRFIMRNLPYHHVVIDEFQDVDRFQFDLITSIAHDDNKKLESLTIVGDIRQCIYLWRGSSLETFNKLKRMKPQFVEYFLKTNFRSLDSIIDYGESIFKIGMKGVRGHQDGSFVQLTPGSTDYTELLKHPDLSQTAILCRFNRDIYKFMMRLSNSRIPFFSVRSPNEKDFWELPHIKLVSALKKKGMTYTQVLTSNVWRDFVSSPSIQDNPQFLNEVTRDMEWLMTLRWSDVDQVKNAVQNDKGIRLSTIHRTKGKEFDQVFLYDTNGIQEREVHYVGGTRAKDKLIIS